MKKLFELFGSLFGILVLLLGLYFEFFGIYHSFSKHGVKDGLMSVFIPPYGWYRAIEFWWHDDYVDVSSDFQVIVSVINSVDQQDPEIQAKISKAVNALSLQFKDYSKDKREMLKEGVWLYIEWCDSLSNDLQKYLVDFFKNRKGTFEKSQQTLDLYVKASKYSKVKEMMDFAEQAVVRLVEEWNGYDSKKSIPQEKIEQTSELLRIQAKSTLSKQKTIYEGVFLEKYPLHQMKSKKYFKVD